MEPMYVTVSNGKATIHKEQVDGCLFTNTQWASAIKPMSAIKLTELYKSLTGKEVKRFASKDDAAKRIAKFINPTGSHKSGPNILPSRKKANKKSPDGGSGKKFKNIVKPAGKTFNIKAKSIRVLDHEKKTFQEGSVRGKCYHAVMDGVFKGKVTVESYLEKTYTELSIDHATALACLKKLCQANQKVQTMELVD